MKKTYVKPKVNIERFSLVQTTAMGCGSNLDFGNATLGSIDSCGWNVGIEVFVNANVCDVLVEEWDGVCYNNPEGGMNVFAS